MISLETKLGMSAASLQRLERPLWAVSIACATIGVFWLPWYFPSKTPINSESYALGFSNRVALVSMAVALACATAARLVSSSPPVAANWLRRRTSLLPSWRLAKTEYLIVLVCTLIWANVLWAWGSYIVDPAWGDARVNIYNIDLLALGRVPYRDFMVIYGFSMIYLPYWLSCLSAGSISFEHAYHFVLVLFVTAGFAGVFVFLRGLRLPSKSRPLILLLSLLSWAIFVTALAHVALRYVCVPAGLVLLHHAIRSGQCRNFPPALAAMVASCLTTFIALAISPDMGLAAGFGSAAYACGLFLRGSKNLAAGCLAGPLIAFTGIMLVFPTYFLTVLAFSGGVFNLPIYPNAHNLFLVAAAVLVLPALSASALRNQSDIRSPLALALSAAGGVMLVGAFGRAGPFHVSCNGVIPITTMFAVAAGRGGRFQKCYGLIFAIVQIVLMQVSWWSGTYGTFSTAIQVRKLYDENPQIVSAWREKWDELRSRHPRGKHFHWSSVLPYPAELDGIAARGSIVQTNGGEWNLWLGRYLLLQPDAPQEFFHCWTQGADFPEQIQARVRECSEAKFLLVPESDLAIATQPLNLEVYQQNIDRWLSWAMLFPVKSSVRHTPFFPNAVIAEKLLTDYKPVGRLQFFIYGPFLLLERKDGPPAASR